VHPWRALWTLTARATTLVATEAGLIPRRRRTTFPVRRSASCSQDGGGGGEGEGPLATKARGLGTLEEVLRTLPGTFSGDWHHFRDVACRCIVLDANGRFEHLDVTADLWDAARALARHRRFLSMRFAKPKTQGVLRRLVEHEGRTAVERRLRDDIFPTALVDAVKESQGVCRRIRLAQTWLKDASARVIAFSPLELPLRREYYRWLRAEAHRLAAKTLRDLDPQPPPPEAPKKPRRGLAGLREHLDDENLWRWVRKRLEAGGSGDPARDYHVVRLTAKGRTSTEIGLSLGISRNAARQLRYRIHARLKG